MAQILALDTSTDACSVALQTRDQTLVRFEVAPRKHTKLLLPMVDSLLTEAGLRVADLDMIAFGRGPGSFAGIRIATGAAQGLALAFETPVVGISTLEMIAWRALEDSPEAEYILAALDARMDELYWCCYQVESGVPVALHEERVSAPAEVSLPREAQWIMAGSGVNYLQSMPKIGLQVVGSDAAVYPEARVMLRLAQREFNAGNLLKPEEAQPVYLREGGWKKKDEQ
ncbi:MAG TPA: tRNA (adenosine(37)-N6)-threonylcarbamoyltransferase complex dimerization subunit type 1 TsaB [Marinobacterium sp.]|nr:tRNA (adenosine(37)-N6)-threonylcarbamoyltransferase complex dimerization subunit type 1 TsaB [Marinobacterium sp.]